MSSIIVIIIFVLKGRRFRSGKCTSAAHLLTETYYELIYSSSKTLAKHQNAHQKQTSSSRS